MGRLTVGGPGLTSDRLAAGDGGSIKSARQQLAVKPPELKPPELPPRPGFLQFGDMSVVLPPDTKAGRSDLPAPSCSRHPYYNPNTTVSVRRLSTRS